MHFQTNLVQEIIAQLSPMTINIKMLNQNTS